MTANRLILSQPKMCDEPLIRETFPKGMAEEILTIPLGYSNSEDRLVRTPMKHGQYTVKSGYKQQCKGPGLEIQRSASSSRDTPTARWKSLWPLNVQSRKKKNLMWNLFQGASPMAENLHKGNILPLPLCSMCMCQPETPEHLFLLRNWENCVWTQWPVQNHSRWTRIKEEKIGSEILLIIHILISTDLKKKFSQSFVKSGRNVINLSFVR